MGQRDATPQQSGEVMKTTINPLASSADRSITFDFDLIRQRELAAQAAGARPGTTDHPGEGQAVARVKRFRRYRNAALWAPRTVSVGSLAPVKLHVVDGVELGAWVGSDVKVYVAAAEVDREEFREPGGVDWPNREIS